MIGNGIFFAEAILHCSRKPSVSLLTSLAVPRLYVCLKAPDDSPGQAVALWADGSLAQARVRSTDSHQQNGYNSAFYRWRKDRECGLQKWELAGSPFFIPLLL